MGYYDRYSRRGRTPQPQKEESTRRGVVRALFSPQIGMSVRPLKETGRILIHMIALLFSQVGLLDRRHPAVTNVGPRRYGLFEVIQLAYQRIEWRQENFLQCAMFISVVACIVITGLAMAYAAFTLLFSLA